MGARLCHSTLSPRSLAILLVVLLAAGCAKPKSEIHYSTGDEEHDKLVDSAISEMMKPAPPAAESASRGWPVEGDLEQSLAKLAEHIREKIGQYQQVYQLVFPEGWVRQRFEPLAVDYRFEPMGEAPSHGLIHAKYQKQGSIIHETEAEAAADNDLIPYASSQSQEQMKRRPPLPQVTLTIEYELQDDGQQKVWRRANWSSEPRIVEGDDFLDRIGVP